MEAIVCVNATWTKEMDAELARLWATGMGAREIAAEMGVISKNAVIGRAWRLKLASRKRGYAGPFQRRSRRKRDVAKLRPVVATRPAAPGDLRSVGEAAKFYRAENQATPAAPSQQMKKLAPLSVVPDDDADLAYPEYDPETRSWFLPGTRREAKTLRILQEKVGAQVKFAGYVPLAGSYIPIVDEIAPAQGVHPIRHAKKIAVATAAKKLAKKVLTPAPGERCPRAFTHSPATGASEKEA
jgi:hypothetical protein